MSSNTGGGWRYEYTVVLVHWFIWGFVALDRNLITFLFPLMLPELKMDFTQAGMAMSALGLTWAVGSILFGGLSDKYGRKTVIVPATFLFSILSWLTGTVGNFAQLAAVRGLLGFPEGSYYPTAVSTIAEEAKPSRRGLMLGLHQSSWAIVGMLLGPIYATSIGSGIGWRWALYLTLIPGIIIAFAHWRFIHEPPSVAAQIKARREGKTYEIKSHTGDSVSWKNVISYRNIIVTSLMSIAIMTWLWNFLSFGTLFVTEFRKVELLSAGFVMSAYGLGGFFGYIGLNTLSDYIGRKTSVIVSAILCAIATYSMANVGADPTALAVSIFFLGLFGFGLFSLTVAAIPAESVPFALAGIAVGIPIAIGEIVGAAVMPTVGGMLADAYGLQAPMLLAAAGALVGGLLGFGLKETAPRVLARRAPAALQEA